MSKAPKISQKQRKTQKKGKKTEEWFQKELESVVAGDEKEKEVDSDEDSQVLPSFIPIGQGRKSKPLPADKADASGSTVLYIGHLPFGLEEYQLEEYFKQFGEVKRSRVVRSTKSGHSKGYGYIEFAFAETAQIASDVMNDYLMFKKRLICRPVNASAARGIDWDNLPKGPAPASSLFSVQREAALRYNENNTELKPLHRLIERENKKRNRLQELGIKYEFDGYAALTDKARQLEQANKLRQPEKTEKVTVVENAGKRKAEEKLEKEEEKKEKEDEGDEETWAKRRKTKVSEDLTNKQKNELFKNEVKAQRRVTKVNGQGTVEPVASATPSKSTPAKEVKNTTTPAKTIPAKDTPAKVIPAKATPAKTIPAKATPAKATPAKGNNNKTPEKEVATPKAKSPVATTVSTPQNTPGKKSATPMSKRKRAN